VEVSGAAIQAEMSCAAPGAACTIAPASTLLQPGVTPLEISTAVPVSGNVQLRIRALGQVRTLTLQVTAADSAGAAPVLKFATEPLMTSAVHSRQEFQGETVRYVVVPSTDSRSYEKWIDEDVRYIITDKERTQFKNLTNDKERDRFVEQFWERRNPSPGSAENKFKEEHYRRIAYANQHFAAKVPGWKTDRGRIYILYGPPDAMKDEPASDPAAPPVQLWHYNSIVGAGEDMKGLGGASLRFVDVCRCNDFRLTSPPAKN